MKAIYRIQNLKTGDFYVGSSNDFTYRKWCHIRDLNQRKHHSPILQNSWNKHGEDAFLFAIVEIIQDSLELVKREQYYLDLWNPRYNVCKLAGSPLGIKHTYQAKMNMSLAHKKLTKEQRGHQRNCKCFICSPTTGKEHSRYLQREERKCFCGCGVGFVCTITSKKKFINGHNGSQRGRVKTKEEIEKQRSSLLKTLKMKKENNEVKAKIVVGLGFG